MCAFDAHIDWQCIASHASMQPSHATDASHVSHAFCSVTVAPTNSTGANGTGAGTSSVAPAANNNADSAGALLPWRGSLAAKRAEVHLIALGSI